MSKSSIEEYQIQLEEILKKMKDNPEYARRLLEELNQELKTINQNS